MPASMRFWGGAVTVHPGVPWCAGVILVQAQVHGCSRALACVLYAGCSMSMCADMQFVCVLGHVCLCLLHGLIFVHVCVHC